MNHPGELFETDDLPQTPLTRAALKAARPFLFKALGLDRLEAAYRQSRSRPQTDFPTRALDVLQVQSILSASDLARIPAAGPIIVAANHPHGALDGLLLADAVRHVRPDARLLANYMLARIPELRDACFFVDPFGGAEAAARSRAGLRAAHLWLRQGGALIMFPAGEVAHRQAEGATRADSAWHATLGRIALAAGAGVVPVFIEGHNSALFYAAGHLHPALRTALLPRELLRQHGRRIAIRVGERLPHAVLQGATTAEGATALAREAVDHLASAAPGAEEVNARLAIANEIAALPPGARLVEAGGFEVYCADAAQIPQTLREIGRLREITYRAIGEGTGRSLDLDRFDARYVHLFAWDTNEQSVVGAYRIGVTSAIVPTEGVDGLYTRTLFRYDERFVARLGPALELGRSWIRTEYQRNYNALLLLWKGIGRFVVERSDARVLFGPVSISARYSDSSHALLAAFLEQNHRHQQLAELVEALHPLTQRPAPPAIDGDLPHTVEEANTRVSRLEADGKGVPVLLRQYLKLNARLIGFNIDPEFGDALDALMMVDLTAVDRSILNRYLGKEGAATFLAKHHRVAQQAA